MARTFLSGRFERAEDYVEDGLGVVEEDQQLFSPSVGCADGDFASCVQFVPRLM